MFSDITKNLFSFSTSIESLTKGPFKKYVTGLEGGQAK